MSKKNEPDPIVVTTIPEDPDPASLSWESEKPAPEPDPEIAPLAQSEVRTPHQHVDPAEIEESAELATSAMWEAVLPTRLYVEDPLAPQSAVKTALADPGDEEPEKGAMGQHGPAGAPVGPKGPQGDTGDRFFPLNHGHGDKGDPGPIGVSGANLTFKVPQGPQGSLGHAATYPSVGGGGGGSAVPAWHFKLPGGTFISPASPRSCIKLFTGGLSAEEKRDRALRLLATAEDRAVPLVDKLRDIALMLLGESSETPKPVAHPDLSSRISHWVAPRDLVGFINKGAPGHWWLTEIAYRDPRAGVERNHGSHPTDLSLHLPQPVVSAFPYQRREGGNTYAEVIVVQLAHGALVQLAPEWDEDVALRLRRS